MSKCLEWTSGQRTDSQRVHFGWLCHPIFGLYSYGVGHIYPVCSAAMRMMCVLRQLATTCIPFTFKFVKICSVRLIISFNGERFLVFLPFVLCFSFVRCIYLGRHSIRRAPQCTDERPNEILLALSILCAADLVWRCNTFGREKVLRTANAPCFCLFCNFHFANCEWSRTSASLP